MNHNETTDNTLRHFSAQLQTWCTERFRQQPGPFRHVELSEHFISELNFNSPPVTFWVNRESYIAGAVVLIPPKDEQESFPAGREIANILGLPVFFTWGRHAISCWSIAYDPPEKEWSYDLPHEDISSPAAFRKSFNLLIDQLEKSFYAHQRNIPDANPRHLANLVYATYKDLMPMMQQAIQIEHPEDSSGKTSTSTVGNALFQQLLLPLVLNAYDVLPGKIPVDTAPEILASASQQLPETLKRSFAGPGDGPYIPKECLRRYNLFVSRIAQLKEEFGTNLVEVTTLLLEKLAPGLGGRPFITPPTDLDRLIINPDHCELSPCPAIEIASSGVLSACALIRQISRPEEPPPRQLSGIFKLERKLSNHHIVGTLHESNIPQQDIRKKLNTFLRISWPNHKLSLPARTPVWIWEFIHLCGLAEGKSRLELTIPKNWLWELAGESIAKILPGKLSFTKIDASNDHQLQCTILPVADKPTIVTRHDGSERMLPGSQGDKLRSQVLIALNMPEDIFKLLTSGDLVFYPDSQISKLPGNGLNNYLKSTLGKHLWSLLAPGRPIPRGDKAADECGRFGIPLPGEKTIAALGRLKGADNLSTSDIDQELTVWLGSTPDLNGTTQPRGTASKKLTDAGQLGRFKSACQQEEVPVFPENYLYEIPSAERIAFSFHGRLKVIDTFFDETILQDRKKQQITVQGTPQKETLLLISTARSGPIELPADQKAMTAILDRYVRDLKALRQNFYRHAITYLPEKDVLDQVDEVWKSNSLPDWDVVKGR